MSSSSLVMLNLITYFISLKIFFIIFGMRYRFPFRTADLFTFFFNLFLFSFLSFEYHPEYLLTFFVINLNLFYIFFHLLNMIVTSPRTKIILDLKENKEKNISISNYLKKYNCAVVVNNRISRLKNNDQLLNKNNFYSIKKNKNYLFFISLVFSIINKV
tara:strand:+ start:22089 stop:22565 length:477 start_codon:yes stop_codon:yes gene_type:complete